MIDRLAGDISWTNGIKRVGGGGGVGRVADDATGELLVRLSKGTQRLQVGETKEK
jgi:hypothetical protein